MPRTKKSKLELEHGDPMPTPSFGFAGLLAGLAALGVYACTLNRGVLPGKAAGLMGQSLGFTDPTHLGSPLWNMIAGWLGRLESLPHVLALNAFSAVCGALSVMFVYRIVAIFVFNACRGADDPAELLRIEREMMREASSEEEGLEDEGRNIALGHKQRITARAWRIALAGGAAAALALTFTLSFWLASTHLQYCVFDAMLLSGMVMSLYRHLLRGRVVHVVTTAFLAGASLLESPVFLVVAPLVLVLLMISQVRRTETLASTIPLFLFSLLAGAGAALGAAHVVAAMRGVLVWDVLVAALPLSMAGFMGGMPTSEGLWVWALTLAPALFVWRAADDGFHRMSLVYLFSHLPLTLVVGYTLANHTWAPWQIAARSGNFLGIPMLLAAFSAGYFFTYWLNIVSTLIWLRFTPKNADGDIEIFDDFAKQCHSFDFQWLNWVFAPVLLLASAAFLLALPVLNYEAVTREQNGFSVRVAAEMASRAGDDNWLFSATPLHTNLRIEQGLAGKKTRVLRMDPEDPVRRDAARVAADILTLAQNEPAMKSAVPGLVLAADVSQQILLTRFMTAIPNVTNRLLCAGSPAPFLLSFSDTPVLPRGFVYSIVPPAALQDPRLAAECLAEKNAFLVFAREWLDPDGDTPLTRAIRATLRRQAALSLNISGLFLEQSGRHAEAFEAYGASFEFAPGNLSAIINRHLLAKRVPAVAPTSKALAEFNSRVLNARDLPPIPARLFETGPISSIPEYLADLQPRFARTHARQALALYEANRNSEPAFVSPSARLIRAAFFFFPVSEAHDAPIDDVTDALCAGDFAGAARLFAALPKEERNPLHAAAIAMTGGPAMEGLDTYFYKTVEEQPSNRAAWMLFLAHCLRTSNVKDIHPKIILALRTQSTPESARTLSLVLLFQRLSDSRNLERITEEIQSLLALFDDVTPLHELLLQQQLLEFLRRPATPFDGIAKTSETILEQAPGHPVALYMRGVVAMSTNDTESAAQCFQQSLAQWKAIPPAAALALTYRMSGRHDEAVEFTASLYDATPTVPLVQLLYFGALVERARLDDIRDAGILLDKLVCDQRDPYFVLTRIRLRQHQRRFPEAQVFIEQAEQQSVPFNDADLHRLAEFSRLNQIEILRAPPDEDAASPRKTRPRPVSMQQ